MVMGGVIIEPRDVDSQERMLMTNGISPLVREDDEVQSNFISTGLPAGPLL